MSPRAYDFKPGTLATAAAVSQNKKLGDCATTYAAQISCPTECVFFDGGGCYAETGQVGKFVTSPLNEAAAAAVTASPRDVALAEARAIDSLPCSAGRPLRLHTVGDCKTDEAARIVARAAEWYMVNGGGPVWTYTHAWRTVKRESWGLVSVLASCETAEDVRLAHELGYATSIVVEEFESDKLYTEVNDDGEDSRGTRRGGRRGRVGAEVDRERHRGGRHRDSDARGLAERGADPAGAGAPAAGEVAILPCPAQTRDRACSSCGLCFDDRRLRKEGITIGFEVHGIAMTVKRATLALRNPDDPKRRMTLEEQLRELLETRPLIGVHEAARMVGMDPAYVGDMLAFIRGAGQHPSVKRADRKAEQARRLRRERGQEEQPCGSFELGDGQPDRGPRRCRCGWLLNQHTQDATRSWLEARTAEKRLNSRAWKRERRMQPA